MTGGEDPRPATGGSDENRASLVVRKGAAGGACHVTFGERSFVGVVSDPPSIRLAKWLEKAGLGLDALLAAVEPTGSETKPAEVARWWRRGRQESRGEPATCVPEDLADVLTETLSGSSERPDEIVEWAGLEHAAMLDVDRASLAPERLAAGLVVQPRLWWVSHSGRGLHALYGATAGWPAEDLASAAALGVFRRDPSATAEVLAVTRHPAVLRDGKRAGRPVPGATDPWTLGRLLRSEGGTADPEAVAAWLAERGMEVGGHYRHDVCPGNPCTSTSPAPVTVEEEGVVCYECRAAGAASWWSWGRLLGASPSAGPWTWLAACAKNLVIADHAALVLAEAVPDFPEVLARPAYLALCRAATDPEDPRISGMMRVWGMVRGEGVWLDSGTLAPILPSVGEAVTQGMPSAQFAVRGEDGEWTHGIDAIRHGRHRTDQRIGGYVHVRPIRGMRLWGIHRGYPGEEVLRIVAPSRAPFPPRYLPPGRRAPIEDVEAMLERWLPRLHLGYLRLLLLARAYAESGRGPVPILAVTGPSKAGKSQTVELAAGMLGDRTEQIRAIDADRFAEAIGTATAQAGFLLADEYAKGLAAWRRVEAYGRWLDLGRRYTHRRLYVGSVTSQCDSVAVITDVRLGAEIEGYAQVARRIVHVRLVRKTPVDWTTTLPGGAIELAREQKIVAEVLDAFLSDFADRWLGSEGEDLDWWTAAERLGFRRLEQPDARMPEGIPIEALVLALWDATADAPEVKIPWVGEGWRLFDPALAQGSPLYDAWVALCDGAHPEQIARIRRAQEVDLGAALGLDMPIVLQVSEHRERIGFRWVRSDTGEVLTPTRRQEG